MHLSTKIKLFPALKNPKIYLAYYRLQINAVLGLLDQTRANRAKTKQPHISIHWHRDCEQVVKHTAMRSHSSLNTSSGLSPNQGISRWTTTSVHYLEKAFVTLSSCSRSIQMFLSGEREAGNTRNTFPTSVRDLKTGRIIDIRSLDEQTKNNLWT